MRSLLLVLTLTAACRDSAPPPREFDGATAFHYLAEQVGFGYRIPGTPGHARMAVWLDSLLRTRADTVIAQAWNHVTVRGDTLPLRNFLARFNPGARERILFLAHWDTRPRSDNPTYRGDQARPVPGANDGASGVAVLLGMADALKGKPATVGVDLLFVDGEDYGQFDTEKEDVLIGSRYYARNQPPGPKPLYAVLFDLVADKDLLLKQEGNSLLGAPDVVELVWRTAREVGHGAVFVEKPGATLIDDHVELQKIGIKAIDIVDFDYGPGNAWWHTPEDTIGRVSAQSLQVVGDVGMALIRLHDR